MSLVNIILLIAHFKEDPNVRISLTFSSGKAIERNLFSLFAISLLSKRTSFTPSFFSNPTDSQAGFLFLICC